MNKSPIFTSLAAISLAIGVSACGGGVEEEVVEAEPEAPAGLSVADGRMNLPAVEGNPGAVYFTISNESEKQVAIRGADMIGAASGALHETTEWEGKMDMQELFTVNVPAGEEVVFAPGGKHVMVYEVDPTLEAGGETEVTLTFTGGDKMSFPVAVLAAGDDGGFEAPAMDHSEMDHEGM